MNMIVRSFEHRLQLAGLGGVTACEVTTRAQLQTRIQGCTRRGEYTIPRLRETSAPQDEVLREYQFTRGESRE